MFKSVVGALTLGTVMVAGSLQAVATTNSGFEVMTSQSTVFEKKLTKAQCLKKSGYKWSSSKKKCVKVTRGSDSEQRGSY